MLVAELLAVTMIAAETVEPVEAAVVTVDPVEDVNHNLTHRATVQVVVVVDHRAIIQITAETEPKDL